PTAYSCRSSTMFSISHASACPYRGPGPTAYPTRPYPVSTGTTITPNCCWTSARPWTVPPTRRHVLSYCGGSVVLWSRDHSGRMHLTRNGVRTLETDP